MRIFGLGPAEITLLVSFFVMQGLFVAASIVYFRAGRPNHSTALLIGAVGELVVIIMSWLLGWVDAARLAWATTAATLLQAVFGLLFGVSLLRIMREVTRPLDANSDSHGSPA